MVSCKWQEIGVDKDNVLEIVDDRFSVEKVVGDHEEVPECQLRVMYMKGSQSRRDIPVERF